jgi:hypothetical protein
MRRAGIAGALLLLACSCLPAQAEEAATGCDQQAAAMPADAGPHMKDLAMQDPMPGEMKRDDMMMGDVAKSAAQKEKCMKEKLKLEEKSMDEKKK